MPLFKGGTALRILYGSPRFSEDLDFSLFRVPSHETARTIEDLFAAVLAEVERMGAKVGLGPKPGPITRGYYGEAQFQIHEFDPVIAAVNVHLHPEQEVGGEVVSIVGDFVPAYNVSHLPQALLVTEKIEALLSRKKARDFYDLYFMLRRGLLSPEHKARVAGARQAVEHAVQTVDIAGELSALLPADQQLLVSDFSTALRREMNRQLGGV